MFLVFRVQQVFFAVTLRSLNTGKELVPEFFTSNFKSEMLQCIIIGYLIIGFTNPQVRSEDIRIYCFISQTKTWIMLNTQML